MGNQQNPDAIYVPPGVNKRYPLSQEPICYKEPVCECWTEIRYIPTGAGRYKRQDIITYNPECMVHGQIFGA